MQIYSSEKCVPYEFLLKRKEMQEEYEGLLAEDILASEYSRKDLSLDETDQTKEDTEDNEQACAAVIESDEEDESEEDSTAVQASDNFDEDHITCYLKEVASYPLLTQEREIELAQIIRRGQEQLVEMIEANVGEGKLFEELHQKVQKLLSHEKSFPGVRDKILKVIVRTLERASKDYPDRPLYRDLLTRVNSIMSSVDSAKQEMVRANLRLVLSVAKRYRGRGMSFDDLIQEGNLGLLKAVGRYDHTKGNRFSTYATWWVRQSIIRGIYDKTRTIRLPVHFIELKNLFFKVFYELLKELGREPSAQEIADRADIPLDKAQMVLTLAAQPVSLETPIGEDEQRLGDFIEDDKASSPLEECSDKQLAQVTRSLLSTLQPREEKILRLRFGLDGQPAETLEKIGKSFNVSKERIRQIEKKALRKLRNPNRQSSLRTFME
ncbi:MAG: sigma-70 family RNA polymerase sigma factor [Desulforhabdus sp.]|jgi:RNA polymerase primary sigma factor|nr:sigma-70 family RNA polymerase sigma factor [Desulforhabdus sp.]